LTNESFHSIDLAAGPDAVWDQLVASGRRDWYYRLTPEGDFTTGGHLRWIDGRGEVVEESEVVEAAAPRKLVLRTRFLFAPPFAAAPPHMLTWEVSGGHGGSTVRIAWIAKPPVTDLLESEGKSILLGLQLAVDPVARQELERLPEIGPVDVRDVTPESTRDYHHFFDDVAFRDYPAWQSCYCMETHRTQSEDEWAARTAADNRSDMTELIQGGSVTALLAFVDGKPVGWCNYGESTRLAGLARRFGLEARDHEGVGSVACFVIAAPYRGHGVASELLAAAIDRLRARGLRAVEAYPSRSDDSAQGNYRGPLEMYVRAGFATYRETDRHVIVRKSLV
jgi:GNAT superfamily N-acetyltransferase